MRVSAGVRGPGQPGFRSSPEEQLMSLLDARLTHQQEDTGTRNGYDAIPLVTAAERRYERAKRVLDLTVALTALVLLSPLLLLLAPIIKLPSPRPIFYSRTIHARYRLPFTR